jgi:hypothetical protein
VSGRTEISGVFGESGRTEVSGVLVRVGGRCIRGFGGLCKGGRTVYSRFSEVFVVDEVFGRSWNDRKKKKIGDFSQ